jgi:hypothetical protein
LVLLGSVGAAAYLDRAMALRAVRRGAAPGFALRPSRPEDDAPRLPLFTPWVTGASAGEVLTVVPSHDSAYRDGAPLAVARLRKAPAAPVLIMGAFGALAFLVMAFAMLFTLRG